MRRSRRFGKFMLGQIAGIVSLSVITATVYSADFASRQVTSFAASDLLHPPVPLGVLNNQLLFVATENGVSGLYRTDGTSVSLIDNSVQVSPFEVAQLSNQLYFAAIGADGKELYSTDGLGVHEVADLAPGSPNSNPSNLQVFNGQLLFNANVPNALATGGNATYFYHTDGTTTVPFSAASFEPSGSAVVNNQFVFVGYDPIGSQSATQLYSTNGLTLLPIQTQPGSANSYPQYPVTVGNQAYVIAGEGNQRGIYATDGTTAQLVTNLTSITSSGFPTEFSLNDGLYVFNQNVSSHNLDFFRLDTQMVTPVLSWDLPAGYHFSRTGPGFDFQPLFVDGQRAYFDVDGNGSSFLYEFDGTSFTQLVQANIGLGPFKFLASGNRLFVTTSTEPYVPGDTYEIVNGIAKLLPEALNQITTFDGRLFGLNNANFLVNGPGTLWFEDNGVLKSLGNIVASDSLTSQLNGPPRFVEFNGQLYFGGTNGTGSRCTRFNVCPNRPFWRKCSRRRFVLVLQA